jgi:hypothetical protein
MVAPNYAKARSGLANVMGLGQQRRKPPRAAEPWPLAKAIAVPGGLFRWPSSRKTFDN